MLLIGRNTARLGRFALFCRRERNCLFVHPATTCASSSARRGFLTFRTRRNNVVCASRWRGCAGWHNPEFNGQVRPAATVNCYQSTSIDAARVNQIILRALRSCFCFSGAGTIGNDVALGTWLVLQLDGVVVETSFLIVETDISVLVKLQRCCGWWNNLRAAGGCPRAGRIQSTQLNRRRYCLATDASSVHRDRRSPLAAADCAGRD